MEVLAQGIEHGSPLRGIQFRPACSKTAVEQAMQRKVRDIARLRGLAPAPPEQAGTKQQQAADQEFHPWTSKQRYLISR